MPRFIIIGTEAFGASTTLHTRNDSNADIHPFSSPNRAHPASIDFNKFVQAEYLSNLYRGLAADAAWNHDDFKCFYHKSGWVVIYDPHHSSLPRSPLESKRITEE